MPSGCYGEWRGQEIWEDVTALVQVGDDGMGPGWGVREVGSGWILD